MQSSDIVWTHTIVMTHLAERHRSYCTRVRQTRLSGVVFTDNNDGAVDNVAAPWALV